MCLIVVYVFCFFGTSQHEHCVSGSWLRRCRPSHRCAGMECMMSGFFFLRKEWSDSIIFSSFFS